MSYGQTGSGKTFTMVGDTSNFVHRGIAPRALGHIFRWDKVFFLFFIFILLCLLVLRRWF